MEVTGQTRAGKLAATSVGTAALAPYPDVVYVVRPGETNEDLRYSLRSLRNIKHGKVFIAGYIPKWTKNVIRVPRDQEGQANQENSNNNLLAALYHEKLSENFIFMNDDFYIMQKTKVLPVMRQGLLQDVINRYKRGDRFGQAYSLIATKQTLEKLLPAQDLYSYELHMPMLMNKTKALAMFKNWSRPIFSLRPRTMYGNLYDIRGVETEDAKTTSGQKSPYISTVYGESNDPTHELIHATFGTPCKYESRT